jgi:hypothetical protein
MSTKEERAERIRVLREKIAEIRRRLPKHSPSMAMMVELDELEDALRQLLAEGEKEQPQSGGRQSA